MNEAEVEEIVDAQLAAMPPARASGLRAYLVAPRREERITRSCALQPSDSWVVAEHGNAVVSFAQRPHLDGQQGYQWIVLERDGEDLGYDDQWYESLDEAAAAAGWFDDSP